jgi:hypothetical protein
VSFSFFFWTVPFDGWGWSLLGLSMLGLTVVLRGNWIGVFGALFVRQSYSTLYKNKILILLIAAAIVINCAYESIISSYIIIPPPVLVARRLKDLVDQGYQIFGWDNSRSEGIEFILKRENISYSTLNEPPFIPNTRDLSLRERWKMFGMCNTTSAVYHHLGIEMYQDFIDLIYPNAGLKCHFIQETKHTDEWHISYSGYSPLIFHNLFRRFKESGILDMFYEFEIFVYERDARIRQQRKFGGFEEAVPFEMTDFKILSIFIGLGILLAAASLVFMAEYVVSRKVFIGTFFKILYRKAVQNALNCQFLPKTAVFKKGIVSRGKVKLSKVGLEKQGFGLWSFCFKY